MKIVIAPDSFKGSLSAIEVANAMERGVHNTGLQVETHLLPVADGGEGTMETLIAATKGTRKRVQVTGPLGNPVQAMYGILGDGKTCVIEVASASGLDLLTTEELNPLRATSFGTGEVIKKALDDGFRSFIIGLGGSATNDGGAGMLQALGARLLDQMGKEIGYGGGQLGHVHSIDLTEFDSRLKESTVLIASDVQNPFVGPTGASAVFGPQKGARPSQVTQLDAHLHHWAGKIEDVTGIKLHDLPGAGAAGGLGGAFLAFFPATIERGIDVVLQYIQFHDHVEGADLVMTGEGQVDQQTASGKTPFGVAQAAQGKNIPTIILAGAVGEGIEVLYQYGVVSVHSIVNEPMTRQEAMENAALLIEKSTEQVVRAYFHHLSH